MQMLFGTTVLAIVLVTATASSAAADDAEDGRVLYQAECALCHFAAELPLHGGLGTELRPIPVMMATYGPKLIGIVGRAAGSDPKILYRPRMTIFGFALLTGAPVSGAGQR